MSDVQDPEGPSGRIVGSNLEDNVEQGGAVKPFEQPHLNEMDPQDRITLPPPRKKAKMSKNSSASPPIFTTQRTLERASSSTSRAGTPASESLAPIPKKKSQKKPTAKTPGRKKKKVDRATSSVPSLAGGVEEEEGIERQVEENDTKLYCICQSNYDEERMMIACDRCDDWYHTACMKIENEQAELVDMFICPNCEKGTAQRTTWKPKCIRNECTHAALRPLSRYCSERCGILVASKRIKNFNNASSSANGNGTVRSIGKTSANSERALAERLLQIGRIATAKRREGVSIWSNEDRLSWINSLLGKGTSDKIASLLNDEIQKSTPKVSALKEDERSLIILPLIEKLVRLQTQLQQTQSKRNSVNGRLDLLASRIKLLHLAEDRSSTLEPIRGEEVETSVNKNGRGKKKTKVAVSTDSGRGQPRCGYDERLHWDDSSFHAWSTSKAGKEILGEEQPLDGVLDEGKDDEESMQVDSEKQAKICGQSKRRCKRHADWSIVRGADFDVDRERQTQILSNLANDIQEIDARLKTLMVDVEQALTDENDRRKQIDEQLARTLAHEGTRRAVIT